MPSNIDTSDSENWGAYRKLIVETLRRLDERTLEMHDVQNKQESRIFVIEQKNYDARLKEIQDDINEFDKKHDMKNEKLGADIIKINNTVSEDRGRRTIINIVLSASWGIVVLLLNAIMNGKIAL